jgi:hypothetical protein
MRKITKLAVIVLLATIAVIVHADDLLTYFPKMSSETYLFAINDKRLDKLKIIAIPEQEAALENLKSVFETNGFRVAIIRDDLVARTLETGMVDCAVSTSMQIVSELKDRFPKGLMISLFPKPSLLN